MSAGGNINPAQFGEPGDTSTCRHCRRGIQHVGGGLWVDPEAHGDDSVWRETCDSHDTFTAEHEPARTTRPGSSVNMLLARPHRRT